MIIIKQRGETILLPIEDVLFAEAEGNYTIFHTKTRGRIVASKTLKSFIDIGLLRCSAKYMVNKSHVRGISGDYIDVGLKSYLKISRRMKKYFLATILSMLFLMAHTQDTVSVRYCDLGFITFLNDTLYHRNSIDGMWSKTYLGDLRAKPLVSNDLHINEYADFIQFFLKDSTVKPSHLDRAYVEEEVDGDIDNELQALRWDSAGNRIGLINVPIGLNFAGQRDMYDSLFTQWFPIPRSWSYDTDFIHNSKFTSFLNAHSAGTNFSDTLANMISGSLYFVQGGKNNYINTIFFEQGSGITYGYQTNPTTTYPWKTIRISADDTSPTNELQTISTSGAAGNITLSNSGGTLNLNVNDADASPTNEVNVLGGSYNSTTNIVNVTSTNGGGSVNFDLSELENIYDLVGHADSSGYDFKEAATVKDVVKLYYDYADFEFEIGSTDHGSLSGLADDDHSQYYNQTRGDARYSQLAHTHDDRYYTETETDALLAAKAASSHTHDDRYYTETEMNNALAAKTDTSHTHPLSKISQSGATTGQVPTWNGSVYAPATPSAGGSVTIEEASGAVDLNTSFSTIADLSLSAGTWKVDASGTCITNAQLNVIAEIYNVGSSTTLATARQENGAIEYINYSLTKKITLGSTTTIRLRARTENGACTASSITSYITAIK